MNKHTFDQTGTKIKGFFGMFDILGYRDFIKQNALDKTIDIFKRLMVDLDRQAVTLGGQDTRQLTALIPTKSLVFSDTIILYQALSRSMTDSGPTFLTKACVLLRLAFERGLPLRGAISFGEFFVHERTFLGMPIIDACEAEKTQLKALFQILTVLGGEVKEESAPSEDANPTVVSPGKRTQPQSQETPTTGEPNE